MSYPNTTRTSTLTHSSLTPSHGKLSAISYSEAMDVDKDGQRLADRNPDKDTMNTTSDSAQYDAHKGKGPEEMAAKIEITSATEPTPVLERPREGKEEGVQQTTQMPSTPQPAPLPPLTQNLISLFGLQPLAATVARTDPVTGEKINKMRKSYEGQLKTLGLAGRNKSVKHEDGKGLVGLKELTSWPEEEWQNQKVMGKDIHKGLPSGILAKLDKAMQMQPGQLPDNNHWEDLLGHDKPKPIESNARAAKLPANTTKTNGQSNGTSATTEPIRPKRSSKKRRYDDESFEGYGEGFVDDEIDMAGYSSGETQFSRKSNPTKKRKKDGGYTRSPTGFERTGSFGSGMVGVSAYSR